MRQRRLYPPGKVATARALRREGKSIRAIAEQMGVPPSTIGDWLRGFGEMAEIRTCWCGANFIAHSPKAVSCSPAHTLKRWKIFGPLESRDRG